MGLGSLPIPACSNSVSRKDHTSSLCDVSCRAIIKYHFASFSDLPSLFGRSLEGFVFLAPSCVSLSYKSDEVSMHTPGLTPVLLSGSIEHVAKLLNESPRQNMQSIVYICSYNQMRKYQSELKTVRFSYIVLDEGHIIRNPSSKVRHLCYTGLLSPSRHTLLPSRW